MPNCTCQRTEIDWHANNTEVSNPHEVEVSVENVHRVMEHLMPVFRAEVALTSKSGRI
ncbi:hypothetical protein ACOSYY_11415 [Nitrospira sp. BLG_2]